MCMFFIFFQSVWAFFPLDRCGQQADKYIAPGGRFFNVLNASKFAYMHRVNK